MDKDHNGQNEEKWYDGPDKQAFATQKKANASCKALLLTKHYRANEEQNGLEQSVNSFVAPLETKENRGRYVWLSENCTKQVQKCGSGYKPVDTI